MVLEHLNEPLPDYTGSAENADWQLLMNKRYMDFTTGRIDPWRTLRLTGRRVLRAGHREVANIFKFTPLTTDASGFCR
jgi:hypothetical protein